MANSRLCSIPNCEKPAIARNWCHAHYGRWKRYGDPLGGGTPKGSTLGSPSRFLLEVVLNFSGDECLIWPFARTIKGYAKIGQSGSTKLVHRMVCEEAHGEPPTPEHHAAHECGNGHLGCVAKRHLFWKTATENAADRVRHGTINRGKNNGAAKLTAEIVCQIRAMNVTMTQVRVAESLGIPKTTVNQIIKRRTWAWLE